MLERRREEAAGKNNFLAELNFTNNAGSSLMLLLHCIMCAASMLFSSHCNVNLYTLLMY